MSSQASRTTRPPAEQTSQPRDGECWEDVLKRHLRPVCTYPTCNRPDVQELFQQAVAAAFHELGWDEERNKKQ